MKKVYAVDMPRGVMLIRANSGLAALRIAQRLEGSLNGPYTLANDQDQAIAWAKSFNAFIHE